MSEEGHLTILHYPRYFNTQLIFKWRLSILDTRVQRGHAFPSYPPTLAKPRRRDSRKVARCASTEGHRPNPLHYYSVSKKEQYVAYGVYGDSSDTFCAESGVAMDSSDRPSAFTPKNSSTSAPTSIRPAPSK